MKYATANAFRTALEAGLLAQTTGGQASLVRLRKLVVFDRLLARLLVVAPDKWIIKGGVALDFRFGEKARATVDLDLARYDHEEQVAEDMSAAQSVPLDDYFSFRIRKASTLRFGEGAAIRYRAMALLDDRKFEEVSVDVGFSDFSDAAVDRLLGPSLLEFAGIPAIEVPVLPLEQHVAEKLHAYSQDRGNRPNTRVKDLIDLILIPSVTEFRAVRLREALEQAFESRQLQRIPQTFPPLPSLWDEPFQQLASQVGIDPDVNAGHAQAAAFLDPILAGTVTGDARWDPATWQWRHSSHP